MVKKHLEPGQTDEPLQPLFGHTVNDWNPREPKQDMEETI